MIIVGITGTIGAGKGTVVDYLVSKKGFFHFSVRGYLTEVIRQKGIDVNRDNMRITANELRLKNSPSYIISELYKRAKQKGHDSVIESIRTPGEIAFLKAKSDFYLFAVDADPKKRYERIKMRNSVTDRIDYETFIENERVEMNSLEPHKQNISQCMEAADFVFRNNSSIGELHRQVEDVLNKLTKNEPTG